MPPDLFTPIELLGKNIHLIPLATDHVGALARAVQDGHLDQLWYTNVPSPEGMEAEIERHFALQSHRSMLPFTVVDPHTGEPVGHDHLHGSIP